VFSTLFGYADAGRLNLLVEGQAELGEGQYVSGDYFGAGRPARSSLLTMIGRRRARRHNLLQPLAAALRLERRRNR